MTASLGLDARAHGPGRLGAGEPERDGARETSQVGVVARYVQDGRARSPRGGGGSRKAHVGVHRSLSCSCERVCDYLRAGTFSLKKGKKTKAGRKEGREEDSTNNNTYLTFIIRIN